MKVRYMDNLKTGELNISVCDGFVEWKFKLMFETAPCVEEVVNSIIKQFRAKELDRRIRRKLTY